MMKKTVILDAAIRMLELIIVLVVHSVDLETQFVRGCAAVCFSTCCILQNKLKMKVGLQW
jgi:hypothetical protein